MKIVIQCAGRKVRDTGFLNAGDGRRVIFVADPHAYVADASVIYARPDDPSDIAGETWRARLMREAPVGLLPAWKLYEPTAYAALVSKYGEENVFVLSAGWGLIRSDFPTPNYDITFKKKLPGKTRAKQDRYEDFQQLKVLRGEEVVFFGGKDYLPFFCALTAETGAARTVFYNSANPVAPGCRLVHYPTTQRTNWHYSCAEDFVAGRISLDGSKV